MDTSDPARGSAVTSYAEAATLTITAGGVTYAYRELGPKGGIPVVFFVHLARDRHAITSNQRGVGASTGQVPGTIEEMADDAYASIKALGFDRIDIFSFSMGGMIAQDLALKHPGLVRKLVLTGTGPRGGKDMDKVVTVTYWDVFRTALTRSDPKEFLFFNLNASGKPAAKAFIKRLQERATGRDKPITTKAFQTQLKAIQRFGRATPSISRTSELIIYPNFGHGRIFQYHAQFGPVAAEFLAAAEGPVD
jgi:pimeloyl-ACP methyl ester carboxylesterase